MKLKALIVESTGYLRDILSQIFLDIGVDSTMFSNGKDALAPMNHDEYAFILVSRYLDDMGGELFLHRYREKYFLGSALTIMISSDDVSKVSIDATAAGYKLVFNKKDIMSMQKFLLGVVNNRSLDLNAKILFIEDQKSAAQLTIALFKNYNTKIDHVVNLSDAKEKFYSDNYDLVITDYYLKSQETGDDVIKFVREIDDIDKARIPILVVSGEADQAKRTSFLRNGANDFIIKPYDNDELIVRASNLIESKKIFEKSLNQQKELMKLAMTDQLTGLYNRHSLFDIGPKYLSDAKRHHFAVSLLVIDLDHFKSINDTHGHAVGDIVLEVIGETMKEVCRNEDFVARFGGEEFVMLLTHSDAEQALSKAELLRNKIEASKPHDLTVTASIGIATSKPDDNFDILFKEADKAVYEAKKTGRNKVVAAIR